MKLFAIKPYTSFSDQQLISLTDGSVLDMKIKAEKNKPIKLNITLSPCHLSLFESANSGVVLETNTGRKIPFVRKSGGTEAIQELSGEYKVFFESAEVLLEDIGYSGRGINLSEIYTGTLASFLNKWTDKFIFDIVGGPQDIQFSTGSKNGLEMLTEITMKRATINYRICTLRYESGVVKPVIEIGDFSDIPPEFCVNSFTDNPNPKAVSIKNARLIDSAQIYKAVLPTGTPGGGQDASIVTYLRNPASIQKDPQFPVVLSPQTNINADQIYMVINTQITDIAAQTVLRSYTYPAHSYQYGEKVLGDDNADSEQFVYDRAVHDLKQHAQKRRKWDIDLQFNDFILPFTRIKVDFCSPNKQLNFKINETVSVLSVESDLSELVKVI
jgi:hypothetical protein